MSLATEESEVGDSGRDRGLPPSMVERMTLIMDAFPTASTLLSLEQVARTTHLPRSTAHRIIDQLVRLGWLVHTSSGYGLGPRALGLGGSTGDHLDLREAAASVLHQLAVRTGMVAHLAVRDGAEMRYLDKVGGRFAGTVPSRVGGRAPAHCTALGKSVLAWLPAEVVDAEIAPALSRHTGRSIADLSVLHQELSRIRSRHGLAYEREECFPGISCVAAAVRGPEGAVAAISLVGDTDAQLEKLGPLVVGAARHVAHELFPSLRPTTGRRRPAVHEAPTEGRWAASTLEALMAVSNEDAWL